MWQSYGRRWETVENRPSTRAIVLEEADDLLLLRFRLCRSAASAARVVRCEQHRCRSTVVLAPTIGSVFEERLYGCRTARAHRAVQRRHPALIHRVWIGARLDEAG